MKQLSELVRPNIWALKPYSCARDEFKGFKADVFIDANENPYPNGVNRYPDPLQEDVKKVVSPMKGVPVENIFFGNGSDEAIDLPFRIFCRPGVDNVVAIDPTYGMYEVCADVNDVEYRKVPLLDKYDLDVDGLLAACDENTKIIFICSPNNPTGNAFQREKIEQVLTRFQGIVIIDEAYSEFSAQRPFRLDLEKYPNMIVLNTFSKAMGCAGIRLGMAFASTEIIGLFNKVKYPYNVNVLTQQKALEVLGNVTLLQRHISMILEERDTLMQAFVTLPICKEIYPTDANFFLAKVTDADKIYRYLVGRGIVVRNRNRVNLCGECLRITIGTKDENTKLLAALRQYV
ncbi:MAG: histidinol-phosphate transaminase [Prevotellaceae bacterium]|nr:histidinol-phosphate transaminase [Candidatus Minthosoma equi]